MTYYNEPEGITLEYKSCNRFIAPKGNRAERRKDIKAFKKYRDYHNVKNKKDCDNQLYDLREEFKKD